jgi:hypothetical protein
MTATETVYPSWIACKLSSDSLTAPAKIALILSKVADPDRRDSVPGLMAINSRA